MMPFPGGIEANANATLIFSLGAAIIYAFALGMPQKLSHVAAKALAIVMLAVLAVMQGGPLLLAAALALSAVGDGLLSREGAREFLGGLASLLLAQALYAVLFAFSGEGVGLVLAHPWRLILGLVMAFGVVAMLALLRRRTQPSTHAPLLIAAVAILGMGLCALTVSSPWIVLGAVLLMASSGLFALERLGITPAAQQTAMRTVVWIAAYTGQAAITLGFLLT